MSAFSDQEMSAHRFLLRLWWHHRQSMLATFHFGKNRPFFGPTGQLKVKVLGETSSKLSEPGLELMALGTEQFSPIHAAALTIRLSPACFIFRIVKASYFYVLKMIEKATCVMLKYCLAYL